MTEYTLIPLKPEIEKAHFTRLIAYIERNLTRDLGPKAETGSRRSESGYQRIAASISASIARELGCNEHKTKLLSLLVGIYFPKYGREGLKEIRQYILDRKIGLDLDALDFQAMCYYLDSFAYGYSAHRIASVIYELLYDYCHGADSFEESRIVRLVQETILDIKKAEAFYSGHPGDLLFDATRELLTLAKEHKTLMKGTLLEPYRHRISEYNFPPLTEEEHKELYDTLDRLISELARDPEDVFYRECIGTPENIVLYYIVTGIFC